MDDWLAKEQNAAVADATFRWLCHGEKEREKALASKTETRSAAALAAAAALGDPGTKAKLTRQNSVEDADDLEIDRQLSILGSTLALATSEVNARRARDRGGRVARHDTPADESAAMGLSEPVFLPDTQVLSEKLRPCLQESEPLPRDFTKVFDTGLFGFSMHLVPEVLSAFEQLGVKHEPLSLIPPQFETPQPPLQPAVFPPTMKELPPPALDLFDLDEHFASEKSRLAQLANKCLTGDEDELEYFLREAGIICGITPKLEQAATALAVATGQVPNPAKEAPKLKKYGSASAAPPLPTTAPITGKDVLEHLLRTLTSCKLLSQETPLPIVQQPASSPEEGGLTPAAAAAAIANGGLHTVLRATSLPGAGIGVATAGAAATNLMAPPGTPTGDELHGIPGSSPLRHGVGAAGMWSGVGAGYKTTNTSARR